MTVKDLTLAEHGFQLCAQDAKVEMPVAEAQGVLNDSLDRKRLDLSYQRLLSSLEPTTRP